MFIESDLRLFRVLSRAYLTITEKDRKTIRTYGFNPTEFAVLELLYHKGPHPLQHIGEKILITSGSITYVVNKLEKKGLLAREPSPDDRRVTFASITRKGQQLMDDIFPGHARKIAKLLAGLDAEEKLTAIALLKKIGLHAKHS